MPRYKLQRKENGELWWVDTTTWEYVQEATVKEETAHQGGEAVPIPEGLGQAAPVAGATQPSESQEDGDALKEPPPRPVIPTAPALDAAERILGRPIGWMAPSDGEPGRWLAQNEWGQWVPMTDEQLATVNAQLPAQGFDPLSPLGPPGAQVTEPVQIGGYTVQPEIYNLIQEFASTHGVPFEVLMGIVLAESSGDPTAGGDAGHSIGLLQLMDEMVIDGKAYRGQGYGMTVEERQDPRRNLEVGIGPIAAAYQEAVRQGLSGDVLIDYVAANSGHPGAGEEAAGGRARIVRITNSIGGPGVPVGAGGAADNVDFEALIYNSDLPRPFSGAELTAGAAQFPALSGVPLIDAMLAASGRPLTDQEAAAIQNARQMAIELRGKTEDWTDADWDFVWREGMGLEDLVATTRAEQKPQQWFRERVQEAKEILAGYDLTLDDAAIMRDEGIPLPEYVTMVGAGMTPQEWHAARDMGLEAEEIWQASKLGYDPGAMRPEQMASFRLRTDLNVAYMRGMEQIPEAGFAERLPLSGEAIADEYDRAKREARKRGEYLPPDEFLRGEYPGLFGGGTASELRRDLETLGGWRERPRVAAETGARRRGGVTGYGYRGGPRESIAAGFYRGISGRGITPMPAGQEMYAQRAMAGAFLQAPGPLGTQTRAEYEEQQRKIRKRYPKLAGREEAGEFETAEQKRLRELKEGLEAGHRR